MALPSPPQERSVGGAMASLTKRASKHSAYS
jgi:hypothetical protein